MRCSSPHVHRPPYCSASIRIIIGFSSPTISQTACRIPSLKACTMAAFSFSLQACAVSQISTSGPFVLSHKYFTFILHSFYIFVNLIFNRIYNRLRNMNDLFFQRSSPFCSPPVSIPRIFILSIDRNIRFVYNKSRQSQISC